MSEDNQQWFEAGPSASAAEAQALRDFRSLLLPSPTTWAWSNLTFIDPAGRPSEIDVILLHRNGLFLPLGYFLLLKLITQGRQGFRSTSKASREPDAPRTST